jgi:integrase
MQERLTAALVRQLAEVEAPAKDTVVFDTGFPRFALRMKPPRTPGGPWASWYFVRYARQDGRERKVKVGSPATMSLDEARRSARSVLARVDAGGDPVKERNEARAVWSVTDLAEAYFKSAEFLRKGERSKVEDRATVRLHVERHLGRTKLPGVDVPAVRRLVRAIESDTRTNSRKRRLGGPGAARRAVRLLSAMMSWAVGEGKLERNPIIGHLRLTGGGQREAIMTASDMARLFETMDQMVTSGALRVELRAFIVCAALTGCRRDELRNLRWQDVDMELRRITLNNPKGAKLAKSGPRLETVSLHVIAVDALATIKPNQCDPGRQVFAPARGKLVEVNREWRRVREAAGLNPELVLHSLRHSLGTAGIIAGMSTLEVAKMLRHRNPSVTARYVHLAEATQSRLQDRAADTLLGR